jgi:NAD(P)-dependent dehydrogenase (short-subunit alcohol dehydrogenase family)
VTGPVLVTGATGGLGGAVVADLLEAGHDVVAAYIQGKDRDGLRDRLGARGEGLRFVEGELGSERGARRTVERAGEGEALGGLVHLAGGFAMGGRLHEADDDTFEHMVELNLMLAYRTARAALGPMVEAGRGGAMVFVGARAALDPFSGGAAYATSKAALLALMKSIAVEYLDDGIRANAVLPSVIDTAANRADMPEADQGAWVEPAAIARVIRFLLSDDSEPTSGASIPVYGRA